MVCFICCYIDQFRCVNVGGVNLHVNVNLHACSNKKKTDLGDSAYEWKLNSFLGKYNSLIDSWGIPYMQ